VPVACVAGTALDVRVRFGSVGVLALASDIAR
jgi:hypothetical protein